MDKKSFPFLALGLAVLALSIALFLQTLSIQQSLNEQKEALTRLTEIVARPPGTESAQSTSPSAQQDTSSHRSRELQPYYDPEKLLAGVRPYQIFTYTPTSTVSITATPGITVFVFEDPLCSFCRALHNDNLVPLFYKGVYSAPAVLVRRHFLVFGENSVNHALLAECAGLIAGSPGYNAAHKAFYEISESEVGNIDAAYEQLKKEGIDPVTLEDIRTCVTDPDSARGKLARQHIQTDQAIAIDLQFDGTPFVIANGIFIGGYSEPESFVRLLEEVRTGVRSVEALSGKENPPIARPVEVSLADDSLRPYQSILIDNGQTETATMTVFLDPLCPYCHRLLKEIEKVKGDYKEKNLAVRYRHFSIFGERSESLAALIECAGKEGGAEAYFKAWELTTDIEGDEGVFAQKIAETTGIASDRLLACAREEETRQAVISDGEIARKLGALGTPHLVVNDTIIDGYRPARVLVETLSRAP